MTRKVAQLIQKVNWFLIKKKVGKHIYTYIRTYAYVAVALSGNTVLWN